MHRDLTLAADSLLALFDGEQDDDGHPSENARLGAVLLADFFQRFAVYHPVTRK